MEALKRLKEELGDQPLKFADDNGKLVDIQDESTLKKLDKASKSRQQSPMHSQGENKFIVHFLRFFSHETTINGSAD